MKVARGHRIAFWALILLLASPLLVVAAIVVVPVALLWLETPTDRVVTRSTSPNGTSVVEIVLRDGGGFGVAWQQALVRVRAAGPGPDLDWTTVVRFSPDDLKHLEGAPQWTETGALRLTFSGPIDLDEGPLEANGRATLVCIRRAPPSDADDCRSSHPTHTHPVSTTSTPTSIPAASR